MGLPASEARHYTTDMTSLIALQSHFKHAGAQLDPSAVDIIAQLFDVVANSTKLSVVLAATVEEEKDPEKLDRRLCEAFKWLGSNTLSQVVRPELGISTTRSADFSENSVFVETSLLTYLENLATDKEFREQTVRWLEANIDAGGQKLRPSYSFRTEQVAAFEGAINKQVPDIGYANFLYCLDFVLKFESYIRGANGPFVGHTVRNRSGLRLLKARPPSDFARIQATAMPIGISFRDPVTARLRAGTYGSWQHVLEDALRTRAIVDRSRIFAAEFSDRREIAQEIVTECSAFFAPLSALERDRTAYDESVKRMKMAPAEAVRDWLVVKFVSLRLLGYDGFDIYREALEAGLGVALPATRTLQGVVVPLCKHMLVKVRRGLGAYLFAPGGGAFEIMTTDDHRIVCSLNTDIIRINDAAQMNVFDARFLPANE